jgi:phytoene dehydrogenase-like protein
MSERRDAIVLGGGANGLAAAAALARAGRRTLLLEDAGEPGGQARSHGFAPGFRSSPLALEAGWLPPAAQSGLGLALPARVAPAVPLSVAAPDGGWLPLAADPARAAEAIARHSARDAERWPAFCARIARQAGILARLYELPPPDLDTRDPGELFALLRTGLGLRRLGRRELTELLRMLPMPVQEVADDEFESPLLRAALGGLAVRSLRFGPRAGGTWFNLLHGQVGAPAGALGCRGYWRDGPDALIQALVALARRSGAELRTASPVTAIRIADDRVSGVSLADGAGLDAPLVLSGLSPRRTLLQLADPVWLDPELLLALRNVRYRGVTSWLSFALDGLPGFAGLPEAALQGTLSLSGNPDDLERGADAAKYGRIAEPLHIELGFPSLRWSGQAPAGQHVLVARVQWTPHTLREGSWDPVLRTRLRDRVVAVIAERAPGFADRILHAEVLTPLDLEDRFGLPEGAAGHGEMGLDQILFMRPVPGLARYATPVDGLYLAGAGSHPGPGIPAGAGWLAARQALRSRLR